MRFTNVATAAMLGMSGAVDVHVVHVGMNPDTNVTGNKFWPEKLEAAPGSMVQFQFWAGNHTVTQSNFADPCTPITKREDGTEIMGIKSGFQPVEESASMGQIPTFTVTINESTPLWFYCGQATHCQKGMSMVINEPKKNSTKAANTLEAYKKKAAGVVEGSTPPFNENAGSPNTPNNGTIPSGGSGSGSGSGSGNSPISGNIPAPPPPQTTAPTAAAAGLSISTAGLLAVGAVVLFF